MLHSLSDMRCPHCSGEIEPASRFCGICGRQVAVPRPHQPSAAGVSTSMSLFQLPVSRGARLTRILLILALDAAMVIAGIAMMVSYCSVRDRAAQAGGADNTVQVSEVATQPPERAPLDEQASSNPAPGVQKTTRARRVRTRSSRGRSPISATTRSSGAPSPTPAGIAPKPGTPPVSLSTGHSGETEPGVLGESVADPSEPTAAEPTEEQVDRYRGIVAGKVARNRHKLRRCYEQASKVTSPDDPLQGKVEIFFTVAENGSVKHAKPSTNTTGSAQLAQCMVTMIRTWRFPAPPAKRAIPFVWPFQFSPPR